MREEGALTNQQGMDLAARSLPAVSLTFPPHNFLDFLPFTCEHCHNIFCGDHWKVAGHDCQYAPKDVYAPVCPVCNKVVPIPRGQDPNRYVELHISQACPTPPTSVSEKAYTNKCSVPGCSNKSVIPLLCPKCLKSHCIKHRLESDHRCAGVEASRKAAAAAGPSRNNATAKAALARQQMQMQMQQQHRQVTKLSHDSALAAQLSSVCKSVSVL